ncbi:MAG: hypothetical protein LBC95_01855 [Candidatus Nomurabacteria bacterium]|jgi:hypothetical protein|nr:hypothetical protein [Candidatus Nomurabacteria bacterium]
MKKKVFIIAITMLIVIVFAGCMPERPIVKDITVKGEYRGLSGGAIMVDAGGVDGMLVLSVIDGLDLVLPEVGSQAAFTIGSIKGSRNVTKGAVEISAIDDSVDWQPSGS